MNFWEIAVIIAMLGLAGLYVIAVLVITHAWSQLPDTDQNDWLSNTDYCQEINTNHKVIYAVYVCGPTIKVVRK